MYSETSIGTRGQNCRTASMKGWHFGTSHFDSLEVKNTPEL